MNRVYIIIREMTDGITIKAVCSTRAFAEEVAAEYNRTSLGTHRVLKTNVIDAPPKNNYRVWIRLAESGIEYMPEIRISTPLMRDTFEAIGGGSSDFHGHITVEAVSEKEAIFRAKGVLRDYLNRAFRDEELVGAGHLRVVPRRAGKVGEYGTVSQSDSE